MAILKYRVEARISRTATNDERNVIGSTWQYEVCHTPEKEGRLISRDEALKIIQEQGLICVHQTRYGSIWDKPHEPLWEKYNGFYSRHKKRK